MTSVFLSYRHEDEAHMARVRGLARRLTVDGATVLIDQDDPPTAEDWVSWMSAGVRRADFVVVVHSTGWTVALQSPVGQVGRGSAWESRLIQGLVYEGKAGKVAHTRFESVGQDVLPDIFRAYETYELDGRYPALASRLGLTANTWWRLGTVREFADFVRSRLGEVPDVVYQRVRTAATTDGAFGAVLDWLEEPVPDQVGRAARADVRAKLIRQYPFLKVLFDAIPSQPDSRPAVLLDPLIHVDRIHQWFAVRGRCLSPYDEVMVVHGPPAQEPAAFNERVAEYLGDEVKQQWVRVVSMVGDRGAILRTSTQYRNLLAAGLGAEDAVTGLARARQRGPHLVMFGLAPIQPGSMGEQEFSAFLAFLTVDLPAIVQEATGRASVVHPVRFYMSIAESEEVWTGRLVQAADTLRASIAPSVGGSAAVKRLSYPTWHEVELYVTEFLRRSPEPGWWAPVKVDHGRLDPDFGAFCYALARQLRLLRGAG